MPRNINKKRLVAATVAAAAVSVAAFAYWTNGGSGSGTAATGSTSAITVVQTSAPTGLFPGGPAGSLAGNFNNTNDSTVYVNQVSASIASVTGPNIDPTHPCDATDYELTGFPVTVQAEVPSGTAQGSWTGGGVKLLNRASDQDGCKGAAVNLTYTSN